MREQCKFLSTPSARRATSAGRLPRRERSISIHALREEGDFCPASGLMSCLYISIHALREEGDMVLEPGSRKKANFYPRPPRGGRQQKQREHPLLLSYYTPLCTNCKEASATRTAAPRRFLHKRLAFRCEASRNTMCAAHSHWLRIKRSARYPVQTPGAVQRARP